MEGSADEAAVAFPIRILTRDVKSMLPTLRLWALGVGELHGQVFREILRARGTAETPAENVKTGLRQLQDRELINEREAALLGEMAEVIYSGGKITEVDTKVQLLHWQVVDEAVSPLAIALSGIGSNQTSFQAHPPPNLEEPGGGSGGGSAGKDFAGAVGGALGGAGVGASLGGPFGAVVGGLIGGFFGGVSGSTV